MIKLDPQKIQIKDYDYVLPDNRIAKYPLDERSQSKLLFFNNQKIIEKKFENIIDLIPSCSLMVFNNTKVIQARILFKKSTGAKIEIFCLEPYTPAEYALCFAQTKQCSWVCMIGNSKKWKDEQLMQSCIIGGRKTILTASRQDADSATKNNIITFQWDNPEISFAQILEHMGELPIPPYLNRETEAKDKLTYQTVYSKIKGSVAAPTAGLHFTSQILNKLKDKGINLTELTLHVGAGTFKPVKSDEIGEHQMHSEFVTISKQLIIELINQKKKNDKVIAIGTTSVRSLESLYYIGYLIHTQPDMDQFKVYQWDPYSEKTLNTNYSVIDALQDILQWMVRNDKNEVEAHTEIFIVPGFKFKIVDGIITNFHQPQSTLLLLVSAFVGDENRKRIYDFAMNHDFRFLSYGDSSLLMK